jgi:hypothetical protein
MMQQIWHVVQGILANPVVRGIIGVSSIMGAFRNGRIVLKYCGRVLSFTKELALDLLALVAIVRSPQKLVEPFAEPLAWLQRVFLD